MIPPNFTKQSSAVVSRGTSSENSPVPLRCNGRLPVWLTLDSAHRLQKALPFPIRIRFHHPDSLFRFRKGTLFLPCLCR